ncbi:hypothetical protein AOCH_001289 [Aspergillus ochraceoroseus]|uniref:DNA topoisomerase (ATP-hydrolyzing) n=1 Tax=Aspergillus ochraceoroseus TaxID=138278 RepID=A0A0F8WM26_9EURO|nr:hypothetical protein AOCH_001289 [Aspergillus ochraceoroseus]
MDDPIAAPELLSSTERVHQYIEKTLAAVLDQLLMADGQPAITLKRRTTHATFFINSRNGALESTDTETIISYSWPGKDAYEAWRFTVAMRILSAIAEAIHSGLVISKRDIYYGDPVCFGTQRVVDGLVDDFALTIGVQRSDLNVEAAAKGLVTGYYQLITTKDEVIDARFSTKDCLIPMAHEVAQIDISNVSWVLILEKEAIYRRLASSSFHTRAAAGNGILITGKGYPDLGTRAFVRKIFESQPQPDNGPRFYALVDSDPDGMAIMSTYKYGSMAHTRNNGHLNVPSLRWLGLRTSDVVCDAESLGDETLIRLTMRDRKKVVSMLTKNPVWAVDGPELEWRAELLRMLMLNVKAETEILYHRHGGLEGWINRQMERMSGYLL